MCALHISEAIQRTGFDLHEMQWHFTFAEYKADSLNQSVIVGYIYYRTCGTQNPYSTLKFKMCIKNKMNKIMKIH